MNNSNHEYSLIWCSGLIVGALNVYTYVQDFSCVYTAIKILNYILVCIQYVNIH